ncbi:MAG: hypothetical protein AMS27_13715 [Bacteroides sp. SM23_62_1]|nr:MAG: hypothetical protein AMS27_13715 [Bacteroides sp. SM23_62_1]
MTKVKLYLIIIIFPCFIASLSCSQIRVEDQFQKVLEEGINRYNDRGVSAAVVFSDNKIWTGTSGISYDTVSIKPDMLFAIGSITKNFVAALTLKLAEEGILSIDDPLSGWLPDYPHIDNKITIHQLLNHTSGIYMFWENQEIWDELKKDRTKVWTPEEVLGYIKEPHFAPGGGWRYSNTNYLLLAMIIKKATGLSLSDAFRNYFWEPLGIENAFLSIEDTIPDNLAHVFGDNFNNDGSNIDLTYLPRASHESITYGSSGLFMTAEDLARWCHTLFEGKVLQQQSLDEMLQFIEFPPVSNMRAYGLGVLVYKRSDSHWKEAIGHSGGNIGTTTYMVYLPEYQTSIAVMVNAFPGSSAGFITKGLIKEIVREYK